MTSTFQRPLLIFFLASIGGCALVALWCIFQQNIGNLEGGILGTLALIAIGAILIMGCLIPINKRNWRWVTFLGIIFTFLADGLSIALIWIDYFRIFPLFLHSSIILMALWIAALAFVLLAILSTAKLAKKYGWVTKLTVTSTIITSSILVFWITSTELWQYKADSFFEPIVGVFATLTAAGTLAMPVLHRLGAIDKRESIRTSSAVIRLQCPRCDEGINVSAGRSNCPKCRLGFTIEIEEEQCENCGYPLFKLESSTCPECGKAFA